jgi:hypothetical protein
MLKYNRASPLLINNLGTSGFGKSASTVFSTEGSNDNLA